MSLRWKHGVRSGLLMALLLVLPILAQYIPSKSQFPSQRPSPSQTRPTDGWDDNDPMLTEKRLRALNEERHKSIVKDTQTLLDLATELNAEIQSTSPETLTPEQLRKWAEAEKLAHRVKENMRNTVGPNPGPQPPMSPANR